MGEIVMPRLSDTMEEGTILRWLAADGQELRRGEELVEIETDKATMVYESDQEGTLEILAREGETLPVGQLIARVGGAAQEPRAEPAAAPVEGIDRGPAPEGPAAMDAEPQGAREDGAVGAPERETAAPQRQSGERIRASPLARRIARERGLDLRALSGSGPGGRIVRRDVQSAAPRPAQAPPTGGLAEEVMTAKGPAREVELSRTQQTIARRMAESKATIPHFALEADVAMDRCVELRAELKRLAGATAGPGAVPTYNDMVVKAAALALRAHPRANASYRDGRLQLHGRVNVGVAVATEGSEEEGGTLIVPTVFDADRKALGEIGREARALAERVREGTITPPELSGGTFTVSNLGMFGVRSFTAIINPPQVAILSVGAVRDVPVLREGEVTSGLTMSLTLACDHRVLYGADAARFLANIRELLEQPQALML